MTRRASYDGKGDAITMKECEKCGKKNAKGIFFTRAQDQRNFFICDHCGQKTGYGWGVEAHEQMVKAKEDYAHSADNRERWQRENTEKFNHDWDKAYDNLETTPDAMRNLVQTLRGPSAESSDDPYVTGMKTFDFDTGPKVED